LSVQLFDEEPAEINPVSLPPVGTTMDLDSEKPFIGNSVFSFDKSIGIIYAV
jgi:hypothetical protein